MSKKVSVIVPTLNPGENVSALRDALARQRLQPLEVIIVDSASTDGAPEQWRHSGARVVPIERADFDHGGTRNLGAGQAQGEILVFMTQDAIPAGERWLENLVAPIVRNEAVATFARQLPREDASLLESFARSFNYPPTSRVRTAADIEELGYRAFFFSNVCSAVKKDVFWKSGGFREGVIFNEDAFLCAKLLRTGHKVKYTAEARVHHSHDYGLLQQFKRNFDIGASMGQAGNLLEGAPVGGEGLRFVIGQARHVIEAGRYFSLIKVAAETAAKLAGFSLGKQEQRIPHAIKRRLSMQSSFWAGRTRKTSGIAKDAHS